MKWQYEWIASNQRVSMLKLFPEELLPIQKAVRPHYNKLCNKLEKLNDIHEGGEATEKQETERCNLSAEVSILAQFLEENNNQQTNF